MRLRGVLEDGAAGRRTAIARVDGSPASHNLLAEADSRLAQGPGTNPPALLVFTDDPAPAWIDQYPGWAVLPLGAVQWLSIWIGREAGHEVATASGPSLFLHGDWPDAPVGTPL